MFTFIIVIVAAVMTFFAVIGFLRVAKASVIILILLTAGLALLQAFGPRLIAIINRLWQFFVGGGLNALAGDGGRSVSEAFGQPVKPPIDPNAPATFYLLTFYFIMILALLIGSLKAFLLSGRFSFTGLLVGLVNGYIVAAYSIAVLFPEFAVLPVPLPIRGMTPPIPPPGLSVPSSDIVGVKLLQVLDSLGSNPSAHFIIAGLIVVFIVLATRLSARKG